MLRVMFTSKAGQNITAEMVDMRDAGVGLAVAIDIHGEGESYERYVFTPNELSLFAGLVASSVVAAQPTT